MAETNEGWIWKFDQWIIEKEHEYLYEPIGRGIGDAFKSIGLSAWDWFVAVLPDLIGFGAFATGAFVILSAMGSRGIAKPLAVFGGITILAACILEAN